MDNQKQSLVMQQAFTYFIGFWAWIGIFHIFSVIPPAVVMFFMFILWQGCLWQARRKYNIGTFGQALWDLVDHIKKGPKE